MRTCAPGFKWCRDCSSELAVERFSRNRCNKDGLQSYCKKCYARRGMAWAKKNRGKMAANDKRFRVANAEVLRVRRRSYRKVYRQRHPHQHQKQKRVDNVRRFFALCQATPRWVDPEAILAVHREAADRQAREGIKYHVDHIYPLCGDGFCGLNVPWNLQVIPASENLLKRNLHPKAARGDR